MEEAASTMEYDTNDVSFFDFLGELAEDKHLLQRTVSESPPERDVTPISHIASFTAPRPHAPSAQPKPSKKKNIASFVRSNTSNTGSPKRSASNARSEPTFPRDQFDSSQREFETLSLPQFTPKLNRKSPEWMKDSHTKVCLNHSCRSKFSVTNRRHHCRMCGKIFCGKCCHMNKVYGYRTCNNCLDDVRRNTERAMDEGSDGRRPF
eukprot:TRINITY_DN5306_c0_g1_i1.p2 TRINITY_DN5306_c0_g1~~TRINITY_DN5306_c0_g1_i1.p2  ORF type:complete len:207 (-),score=5.96 TRINITY_DN5306_c0_g1_i1:101-721(-)